MNARNSLPPSTVLLLTLAFLAGVAGVALAPMPVSPARDAGKKHIFEPSLPFAPPNPGDSPGSGGTARGVKFTAFYSETREWKESHVRTGRYRMDEDVGGDLKSMIRCRAWELNDEQRTRLEATIKMYEDSRADLIAMAGLIVRLKVETEPMRQISEDVPKVTAALDTSLGLVLEKLDEAAKRRDKGEDAGLPEQVAIAILENVLDAFGNMKKNTEKILNDAKRTPQHYKEELARVTGRLATTCAAFEQTAGQVEALRADNDKALALLTRDRGLAMGVAKKSSVRMKVQGHAIVRQTSMFAQNGSSAVNQLATKASQSKIEVK